MNCRKTAAIAAAAGALTALTIPAIAETSFYGSARMATFYNIADVPATGKTAGFDEHLQGNSTFGMNTDAGEVKGKVELGTGAGNVALRLLYGTWNFGAGKLTVGQDYNSYYLGSAQVHTDDNAFKGYGAQWDTRQPQIRVNLDNGVYFAAIQPTGNVSGNDTGANAEANTNVKMYLPKLNIGYAGKAGAIAYNVGVVGSSFKNAGDRQITAVLGYVTGSASFGATSLLYSASVSQNAGDMGFTGRAKADAAGKDAIGFEGFLQVSQKISDTITGNAGFGYAGDRMDVSGAKFNDKMSIFVNAPITLAKNVTVTPEFDYYDQLNNAAGKDENKKAYALGAKWQINF